MWQLTTYKGHRTSQKPSDLPGQIAERVIFAFLDQLTLSAEPIYVRCSPGPTTIFPKLIGPQLDFLMGRAPHRYLYNPIIGARGFNRRTEQRTFPVKVCLGLASTQQNGCQVLPVQVSRTTTVNLHAQQFEVELIVVDLISPEYFFPGDN
jgi:hypothetical protein